MRFIAAEAPAYPPKAVVHTSCASEGERRSSKSDMALEHLVATDPAVSVNRFTLRG
jgi:hypothetical protein